MVAIMESAPTLETVCQAITTLYHNPEATEKEKSSEWLDTLQRSVFAWKLADELLQQSINLDSSYFAAQTMRTKIRYAFHELPLDSHASLRDSLLIHLSKVTEDTATVIITQLCLALADLTLQMVSWKTPVQDIISRLGATSAHSLLVLLELLHVLPEELGSRSLRLGANRRTECTEMMKVVCPQVVHVLNGCLQSIAGSKDEERLQVKVFQALGSWFSIGAVPSEDPALHNIMTCIFYVLMNPSINGTLHEAATDCICSALVLVEDFREQHGNLTQFLCHGVHSLLNSYHMSVAQEDPEKAINYCRIFTELAESLMDSILSAPGRNFRLLIDLNQDLGTLDTLELLLVCVGHHDFEVAEITFNVWYRLSEALYKVENDVLNKIFQPYVERLIIALTRHCEMEPDHEGIPEEKDDFGEFRNRVTELIKDIIYLVGSNVCFRQMFESLKNQGANCAWYSTEAALFVMAAVAKNIIPTENETVPQVIHTIFAMQNTTHVAVRYTSTRLLGELCEWIERHINYLDPALNWLLSGLQEPVLASMAATSLQNICSACRKQMSSHFDVLLQIVKAMDQFSISSDAALGLLKGTCAILSLLPPPHVTDGIRQLCAVQTAALSQVLDNLENTNDRVKTDPTAWLDRLAAIFRHTSPTVSSNEAHPCQPVVEEVWPVLSRACSQYQDDTRIVERCCRCIRFMVRCVGRHSAALLEPLVTQMVTIYQQHQHSCFLYLGSILVDEYGMEIGCVQGLLDMLQAFCGPTFLLLENANGLRNHPDTVDDLFRLCTRFLQRASVPFLKSPVLESLIQCSLAAATLDHREANSSVMKFFYDLLKISRTHQQNMESEKELVKDLISKHGQTLVLTLLHASVFCLSTYMLPDVADVIYEMLQFDQQRTAQWLEEALRVLPTHTAAGMISATPDQLAEFHRTLISAEHVKTVTSSLREFSRLFQ